MSKEKSIRKPRAKKSGYLHASVHFPTHPSQDGWFLFTGEELGRAKLRWLNKKGI
jgi:hypothetical protein